MKRHNIKLTNEERAYVADFLDGDGCMLAQIVKGKDYKYGYTVHLSIIFFQKSNRHSFLLWLKSKLKYGYLRIRNNEIYHNRLCSNRTHFSPNL